MSYLLGILCCMQLTPEVPAELLAEFMNAEDPETAGNACWKIFTQFAPVDSTLEPLCNHEDPGIAIQATWRLYHRILPISPSSNSVPFAYYSPDLNRFLGLTQGRLGTSIPKWWERMVESADAYHPDRTKLHTDLAIPVQNIVIKSNVAELKVGDESEFIPADIVQWMYRKSLMKECQVVRIEDDVFVLSVPTLTQPPCLSCVSRLEMKERWRQVLWGRRLDPINLAATDANTHVVSLRVSGSKVTVFGSHSLYFGDTYRSPVLYIEQFSIVDGRSTVRFSTDNWGIHTQDCPEVPE